jgi:hypothetical protein
VPVVDGRGWHGRWGLEWCIGASVVRFFGATHGWLGSAGLAEHRLGVASVGRVRPEGQGLGGAVCYSREGKVWLALLGKA